MEKLTNAVENLSNEMNEMKKSIQSMKGSMESKMSEMEKFMYFINDKFEEALKEMNETKKENVKLKKNVTALESTLTGCKEKVRALEVQVLTLNNTNLSKNLEIVGIPCKKEENCNLLALNVAKQVCSSIKQEDIEEAFRIGKPKDSEGKIKSYRPLLVKFKDLSMRNKIFKNKKILKGVNTVKMGISQKNEKLFINENLCHETKAIFTEANAAKKIWLEAPLD